MLAAWRCGRAGRAGRAGAGGLAVRGRRGAGGRLFGLLYGEFFGPTGLVPALWLAPLDQPIRLLLAAVGVGAVLLAGAYALGTVNRVREGGWRPRCTRPPASPERPVRSAPALAAGGWYAHRGLPLVAGGRRGGRARAGRRRTPRRGRRRGPGVVQALVELFDLVVRLGSNVVSFARLAAFGLTHAALGCSSGRARRACGCGAAGHRGGRRAVFVVGNAVAFGLEALVAAIQALRLEYYELFSRVFEPGAAVPALAPADGGRRTSRVPHRRRRIS